ncbi:unnamed protein product [Penicillium olsonii]|nr:unnamed protein product [Penicillium olsonii]CAG7929702.1 unnamed protein product [Penicillium olsonii]
MARSLETIDRLATKPSARGGALCRYYHSLMLTFLFDRHSWSDFSCLGGVEIHLFLRIFTRAFIALGNIAIPLGAEHAIPKDEERLGEVGLDTPALVVDVVVSCIVGCKVLQRIPGELVATVVIDGLDS